ncbi:hypothetical protein RBWH47_05100 [Rhodopirellula baltica WH47]|nr:hypothetical protein RBWH47_05100 [Rhodopirellula baltica WH47]
MTRTLASEFDCNDAWPLRVARRNSWGQLFYSDFTPLNRRSDPA